jgi:acyl carrier protein
LTSPLTEIIADTLDIPPAEVTPQLSARSCKAWDSKGHIALMIALEGAYKMKLSIEQMEMLTSVAAIEHFLARRK